ncbi:MAG: alpha-glucan family phosphorylase [Eubacteriales bacterium]|nr:alpha-glucan family phosphorylase [Eubacteriales bacterium]
MYAAGKIRVSSVIPPELLGLEEIASNLWWSWNKESGEIFSLIDSELWEKTEQNPVKFLKLSNQEKLLAFISNNQYMSRFRKLKTKYDEYMSGKGTWFSLNYPEKREASVAYFSAEYGISSVLPIYSGGLGVLSGDHCKSASDLGIPFTAIGLFYKQGYFQQHLNSEGAQETAYIDLNPDMLPMKPALDSEGNQLKISVDFPGRKLYAKIWRISVGRISLYLMDTDVDLNEPADRSLTARLYGGDQETRIQQEILLGIGGSRLIDALGVKPSVYHMNEGHSSFLGLELMRKLVQEKGLSLNEAMEAVKSLLVFTTHTPVPAGNDIFPASMVEHYFSGFWDGLNILKDQFIGLGLRDSDNCNFNMTVLALKLSGKRNGVSKLHGMVTRHIFNDLWKDIPEDDIPVTHITNGIHTPTWLARDIAKLYDEYLPDKWIQNLHEKDIWESARDIPANKLWDTHLKLKRDMIAYIKKRLKKQLSSGAYYERGIDSESWLDPNALTIGFARRFATYKRADLIFRNLERIRKIMNKAGMPVQIIFAGKAHPADHPAQDIIKKITDISRQEGFVGKVIMLENYDMALARRLVQGVDVWMNNPRRPLEASGTSGQKVCANGILNFSVQDGWWYEGYNSKNGWSIGDEDVFLNERDQDSYDSASIYEKLEHEIIPMFFDRNGDGVPEKWVDKVKESIISLTAEYSTHRMLKDYWEKLYLPSLERTLKISQEHYKTAKNISAWKSWIKTRWQNVSLYLPEHSGSPADFDSKSGEPVYLRVNAYLGELSPEDVCVEVYYGKTGKDKLIINARTQQMEPEDSGENGNFIFSTEISIPDAGEFSYTFRIYPYRDDLNDRFDLGLVKWINLPS